MAVSMSNLTTKDPVRANGGAAHIKAVMKLLAGIIIIMFFMLYAGPKLGQISWFKPMADFIEERDIAANMYFYTEVEEFSEANINMENTMAFPPGARR